MAKCILDNLSRKMKKFISLYRNFSKSYTKIHLMEDWMDVELAKMLKKL